MVAEKYKRRIDRLLDNIKNADSILIVYIETPCSKNHALNEEIINGYNKIKDKYPSKEIDILYLTNDTSLSINDWKKDNITSNIIKVVANYKDNSLGAVSYAVNNKVLKIILKQYSLKTSFLFKLKQMFKRILIKLIPIKSIRKKLRKKYHV